VVANLFAYLSISFLSLVGRLYDFFFATKNIPEAVINISEVVDNVRERILNHLRDASAINQIQSLKFLLNIGPKGNLSQRNFIFKKEDGSPLSEEFLSERIDVITSRLKQEFQR